MTRIATVSILAVVMSAILDGLLGSLEASSTVNSDMSGSFQLGFGGGGDYDYGGSGVDRNDHYGGHSGSYHEACCPLVVDVLCVAAIIFAIGGAAVLLSRIFQIELCQINGVVVNAPCPNPGRRRKREIEVPYRVYDWSPAGFYGRAWIVIEGKEKAIIISAYCLAKMLS